MRRALLGGMYGALMGVAYAGLAHTVDALTFRDVPMQVDAVALMLDALKWGLLLAALGGLTAYPTDTWRGVVSGAATVATAVLLVSLWQARTDMAARFITFAVLSLPVLALCLPLSGMLRWLANQHIGQHRAVVGLVLIAVLLGSVPGAFQRMSPRAAQAVREVQRLIQVAATDDVPQFKTAPGLPARLGQPYTFSQAPNPISLNGVDVTAHFADGYTLVCPGLISGAAVVVYACAEK